MLGRSDDPNRHGIVGGSHCTALAKSDSAVEVDTDGRKHVLGVWLGDGGEGAKFWLSVLTELKNRGVADVIG